MEALCEIFEYILVPIVVINSPILMIRMTSCELIVDSTSKLQRRIPSEQAINYSEFPPFKMLLNMCLATMPVCFKMPF